MYAVASINLPNYQDLADLTDPYKQEYCDRHGYQFFVLKENKYSDIMGFNKLGYMLDILKTNPDIDWLLFSECDATITNLTIPMEEKIDNDYHVIVPVDRLNLNCGNLLVRNSQPAHEYLQMILDLEDDYRNDEWAEQQAMIDTFGDHTDIVKVVPQRYMNSYIQAPYDYCDIRTDILGTSGEWQPGDWIYHMPGLVKEARISMMNQIAEHIVK